MPDNLQQRKVPTDYISVVYDPNTRPYTSYPYKLTEHLYQKFNLSKAQKLLDVGCGRGEFLAGFVALGMSGYGVDQNLDAASKICDSKNLRLSNIEQDGLPFPDNYFDVVFSKSVIEHFHDPDKFLSEAVRVLKPGGTILTMCPSWEHNFRIYFEDHTHRTPFMKQSLHDIYLMHGLAQVKVLYFIQLPIMWSSFRLLVAPFVYLTRTLAPRVLSKKFKWVRFSKEVMLLGSAIKPKNVEVDVD